MKAHGGDNNKNQEKKGKKRKAVDAVGEKSNGGKRQRQRKKPIAAGVAGGGGGGSAAGKVSGGAAEDSSAEGDAAVAAVAAAVGAIGAVERGAAGAAGVKRKRACGLCKGEGHTQGSCPQKEFAKPETPNADLVVEEGMAVGVFDVENSGAVINEIGLVGARFSEGQWVDQAAEFHYVTGDAVTGWARAHCRGLAEEARKSSGTYAGLWQGTLAFIITNNIIYLKAHNGVATDLTKMVVSAKLAGIEDPIGDLMKAGVRGIIDPARFIPQHGLVTLQHEKTDDLGGPSTFGGYLKNEVLYSMVTGGATMAENGLTAHRALDDAKAERAWLRLEAVTEALYGSSPRLQCAVSLASFRVYSEQYEKHHAFLA